MKKLLLFVICIFSCLVASAQTEHIVKNDLVVWEEPTTGSNRVCTLNEGTVVDVYEINGEWARIKDEKGSGYVPSSMLYNIEEASSDEIQKDYNPEWLIYVILGLSILLFLYRMLTKEYCLTETPYVIFIVLYLALCLTETLYFSLVDDFWWFWKASKWYFKILIFIVHALLLYNQFASYAKLMYDTQKNNDGDYNFMIGIYAFIVYAIGIIIVQSVTNSHSSVYENYVIIAAAIIFLIQLIIILFEVVPYGGWKKALLTVALYIPATLCTCIFALASVYIILFAYILVRVIEGGLEDMEAAASTPYRGSSSSSQTSSSDSDSSDGARRHRQETHARNADEYHDLYRRYKSKAEDELREGESYLREAEYYANKAAENNDDLDRRSADDYKAKAESCFRKSEEYMKEAERYYEKYESETAEAR